jgi:hypothetical protein
MPMKGNINAGVVLTILITLGAGILCAIILVVAILEAKPYPNQRTSLPFAPALHRTA